MDLNPIVLSIPVYFLLIGLELLVQLFSGEKIYRLNDAVTNISCGITQQVSGVFIKVGVLALYELLYQYASLFEIPMNLTTGIILFVLVDLCYYWAHRMSHEVNLFWGGHVVHHQSEDYNFSVALRQGSFQVLWTSFFYLPLAVLGFDTLSFVFASALVTIYQFWIHTEKIGKLGPLEWIMNTPSHHRVHHGRDPKYIDKNHAGVFIIWDRMFGTFQVEEEKPTYGITTPVNSWNPVWVNLQHYHGMWQQLKTVRNWKERLQTLFYKPGWRPEHMGGYMAPPSVDKENYHKFSTPVPPLLGTYVIFQYLLVLGGAALFLFQEARWNLSTKGLVAALVIFAILAISWLLENKSYAFWVETLRLLVVSAVLLGAYIHSPYMESVLAGHVILLIISYVWLYKIGRQYKKVLPANQQPQPVQAANI